MAETEPRPAGMLRDPALWLITLVGVVIGGLYGIRFGPSIGETATVGAVAIGIMGAAPGFVAGLVVAWMRYRSRRQAAFTAERARFVATLNASEVSKGNRFLISTDDPSALILDLGDPRYEGLAEDARKIMRDRISERIGRMLDEDGADLAAELRQNRFNRWIVAFNGETLLERRFD